MGRTPCCDKNGLKKGPWTTEEDSKLIQHIQLHGPGNWRSLPKNAGLQRCGKSCRLRWTNYLRPDIKRGRFSFEEEESIIQLHSVLGNKWSSIAARLPGRTDNEIKNYWNTHIRKRLLRNGIDPVTHAPRLDFLDLSSLLNTPQLNLSNLLRLQTLLNPEALRLALNLVSVQNDQNTDILLQKLQENQVFNSNHFQAPLFFQPNQFENIINRPTAPSQNQNLDYMQGQMGHLPAQSSDQLFQGNVTPAHTSDQSVPNTLPNLCYGISDQMKTDLMENSSFQSMNSSSSNSISQHVNFDHSVLSTPLSSPIHLNSASTLMNGRLEGEKDSFCCSLLTFEIPEGFNFDDFM